MAKGPRYRVAFRRRREGKTNYHRRLKLIKSGMDRLIVRCSTKHTVVQVAKTLMEGDKILCQARTDQLEKQFGWKFNSGNIPSAYLAGYLCGLKAKKEGLSDLILDVGVMVHNNRVISAFKGFLDGGVSVEHDESWFPESLEERIDGSHIQSYAELLKKEDSKAYNIKFSATLKKKADPTKIVKEFETTKSKMEKAV